MAQPTPSDVHVNQLLTNVSIGYVNTSYIADMLFPMVPVEKQSDVIPQYDQSQWFRDLAHLRAVGTASRGSGFNLTNTNTYFANRYSFRFEIPDDVRANTDAPYDMDRDGTEFVTDKLQMKREVSFASDFFTTSVWTGDQTGVSGAPSTNQFRQWNDYTNATPLVDLSGFMDTVEGRIAREPNMLTLGKQVWTELKWHPDVIDTIKYTQRAQMTTELFAALLELAKINVGRAIYTTTAEGTAEASVSYTRIWGKAALLLYVPERPSLMQPAAGYTFVWRRVANAIQYIKSMRDEEREVDIIEGNSYFDQAQTAAGAGLYMASAVA